MTHNSQARERMRQKFGQSNGLRPTGSTGYGGGNNSNAGSSKMQGIGSDPNYQANGSGRGDGGVDINEFSATAFNFVSGWVDTVSKVCTRVLIDEYTAFLN